MHQVCTIDHYILMTITSDDRHHGAKHIFVKQVFRDMSDVGDHKKRAKYRLILFHIGCGFGSNWGFFQVFVKDPDGSFAGEIPGSDREDDRRRQDPVGLLRHPGRSGEASVENHSFIYQSNSNPSTSHTEFNLIKTDENLFRGWPQPTYSVWNCKTYLLQNVFKVSRFVHSYDFKESINIKYHSVR